MKKCILSFISALILVAAVFAGCGNSGVVTQEQAQKIALEEAGLSASDATDVHTHVTTVDGIPCYSVHITTAEGEFSIVVSAADGTVIE